LHPARRPKDLRLHSCNSRARRSAAGCCCRCGRRRRRRRRRRCRRSRVAPARERKTDKESSCGQESTRRFLANRRESARSRPPHRPANVRPAAEAPHDPSRRGRRVSSAKWRRTLTFARIMERMLPFAVNKRRNALVKLKRNPKRGPCRAGSGGEMRKCPRELVGRKSDIEDGGSVITPYRMQETYRKRREIGGEDR